MQTQPGQAALQARQRVMQPPARRAAEPPGAGRLVVEDVDRNHLAAGGHGLAQRRIVGEAQVVAEPDERRLGHVAIRWLRASGSADST